MSLPRLAKPLMTAVATTAVLTTAACGGDADDGSGASESAGQSDNDTSGEYADGTYEASGSYSNPSGTSEVAVELTLEDNTVSDVTVSPQASGTSAQFQGQFAGGIADEVVGRNIDELDVDKVAGSSLTAGGFNEALESIKADASG